MASKVELDTLVSCLLSQGIGKHNAGIVRNKLADLTPKSAEDVRAALDGSLELPTIEKVVKLIENGIPVEKTETKAVKPSELKSLRKQVTDQGNKIDALESSVRALDAIVAGHDTWIKLIPLPDTDSLPIPIPESSGK